MVPTHLRKHHSLTTTYMPGNTQKEDRRGQEGHRDIYSDWINWKREYLLSEIFALTFIENESNGSKSSFFAVTSLISSTSPVSNHLGGVLALVLNIVQS